MTYKVKYLWIYRAALALFVGVILAFMNLNSDVGSSNNRNIINGGDVQRKNVVNNVDKSSLWAPWQNGPYKNTQNITKHGVNEDATDIKKLFFVFFDFYIIAPQLQVYNFFNGIAQLDRIYFYRQPTKMSFLLDLCKVNIWQQVKAYVRAQMLISVLLRMQK